MLLRSLTRVACAGLASVAIGCTGSVETQPADAGKPDAPIVFDGGAPFAAVDLTGCPQQGYAGTFVVGGAPFSLVVDTGSGDIGVAGATCSNCTGVMPLYTPSATAVDQHARVTETYVSGDGWSGEAYRDSFGAGRAIAPTRLVAIDSQSDDFFSTFGCGFGTVPFSFQGIAGFGPAVLADPNVDDPMSAFSAAAIPDVFAFALCDFSGKLWLGGYGAEAAPKTTPLIAADPFYAVELDDIGVNGTMLGSTSSAIGDLVIDTDTTELELPNGVYNAVKSAIGASAAFQKHFGDGGWFDRAKCTQLLDASTPSAADLDAELPTLTLRMADGAGAAVDVTLTATQSYLEPVKTDKTYYCPEMEATLNGSTVLGSAAMRRELVVIDRAAGVVRFAPYSNCADGD